MSPDVQHRIFILGMRGLLSAPHVETSGQVIPATVGSDINCGMRLQVADLSVEQFWQERDRVC